LRCLLGFGPSSQGYAPSDACERDHLVCPLVLVSLLIAIALTIFLSPAESDPAR
jgi:hypothetical protein